MDRQFELVLRDEHADYRARMACLCPDLVSYRSRLGNFIVYVAVGFLLPVWRSAGRSLAQARSDNYRAEYELRSHSVEGTDYFSRRGFVLGFYMDWFF